MTIKQQRTIDLLPKNRYNISKSMREAGYTKSTSVSGEAYESIRLRIIEQGIYNPARIAVDEEKLWRKAEKANDLTNLNRQLEGRRKVAGMITDRQEVENKHPEKIIIQYVNSSSENRCNPL